MTVQSDFKVTTFGPALAEVPVVSVKMITYNQEPYIRQAIESVFAQDFDGPMELVIGEDCSTDNTRTIIEDVCRDAPIHVRLVTSERNVGMHLNSRRVTDACSGLYVALLEGDDYWACSHKLKSQVDLLERFPSVQAVAHRARLVFEADVSVEVRRSWGVADIPRLPEGLVSPEVLLDFREMIPAASLVVRRSLVDGDPAWLQGLSMGDCYRTLKASLTGGLYLLDGSWSFYRVTTSGAHATAGYIRTKWSQVELVRRVLIDGWSDEPAMLVNALRINTYRLAFALEQVGQVQRAAAVLWGLVAIEARYGAPSRKSLLWLGRLKAPKLWRLASDVRNVINRPVGSRSS